MTSKILKKANKLRGFDDLATQILQDDEKVREKYLETALKDFETSGDRQDLITALRILIKAKGVSNVAKAAGLTRDSIYKTLDKGGNPTLNNLLAILKALNYKMTFKKAV